MWWYIFRPSNPALSHMCPGWFLIDWHWLSQVARGPWQLMPFLVHKSHQNRPPIHYLLGLKSTILDKVSTWHPLQRKLPMNLLFDNARPSKDSCLQMQPAFLSLLPVIKSSPSVTMYGTSNKFCWVGLLNPLFVDIPAIQIASNPLFWDKNKPDFGPSNLLSLDKKWPELPRACCKDDGYSDAKSQLLWLWPLSLRGKCIIVHHSQHLEALLHDVLIRNIWMEPHCWSWGWVWGWWD